MKDTWLPKVYFSRFNVFLKVIPGILTKVACGSKVDKDGVGVRLLFTLLHRFLFLFFWLPQVACGILVP